MVELQQPPCKLFNPTTLKLKLQKYASERTAPQPNLTQVLWAISKLLILFLEKKKIISILINVIQNLKNGIDILIGPAVFELLINVSGCLYQFSKLLTILRLHTKHA